MSRATILLCAGALIGACGGGDDAPDAAPEIDARAPAGTLSVSWTIADADGGATIGCGAVGATSITVTALPAAGGTGVSDLLSCAGGSGTTQGIKPGLYHVDVGIESPLGPLADVVRVSNVQIVDQQDTALDPVAFTISRIGEFRIRIDTSTAGTNCDALGTGAAITELHVEAKHGGVCEPVSLAVGTGTYAADCAGARHACFEEDVVVSADVPAGAWSLEVTGYRGADACYKGTTQFDVRGAGQITTVPKLVLQLDTENEACDAP